MRLFGRRRFGVLAFVALVLAWGSTFSVVKIGLEDAPPVLFAGGRTGLSGIFMMAVALVWGGAPNLRRDWRIFALLGVLNVVLFIGMQTFAIMYLPSGTAAVLIYLQPILVGVFAWAILDEALTPMKILGLLLGFAGIVAVSSPGLVAGSEDITLVGVACGVASGLFWAVAIPLLVGGAVLTGFGLMVESPAEISWTSPLLFSTLYSALIGTGLAWLLFFGLVRAGEASRVASYIFVVPLTAVAIGAVFLNESLGPSLLVGAALVVSGIYLVNRTPRALEEG